MKLPLPLQEFLFKSEISRLDFTEMIGKTQGTSATRRKYVHTCIKNGFVVGVIDGQLCMYNPESIKRIKY